MASDTDITKLKVAIVHEAMVIPGGSEKVTYELHKMFPNAPIYAPVYRADKFPEFKDANIIPSPFNRFAYVRSHHQLFIPLYPYWVEQFDLSEYDIVISNSTSAAKGAITRPETLHICYCETPMRWAWMPYVDIRASYSLLRRITTHYLRIWDSTSVNRVDAWIANSKTIARRIRKFYRKESTVIYPPVDIPTTKISHEDDGYYLVLGRLEAQKRVDIIVKAAIEQGFRLKIAGKGAELESLKKLAQGAKNIQFLGYVTDAERSALYSRCKAFIFASEEDFGIVPVEAMSYGKPVIAYGRGGGSETVIDKKTGLLFMEQTSESLVSAVNEFEAHSFDPDTIAKHAQTFATERFHREMAAFVVDAWEAHQASLKS